MSHFTVLVIGENPEQQLQPYHEYECTGIEDEYVVHVDRTEEVDEWLSEELCVGNRKDGGELDYEYSEEKAGDTLITHKKITRREYLELQGKKIDDEIIEYHGYEKKDGKWMRYTNPNKKWDWYQLGGRWTGFFKLKLGATGGTGEPGLLTSSSKEGYADVAFKKDIDFDYMRNEAANNASQKYDFAMSIFGDFPVNENWDSVREKIKDIDKARAFYWNQPRCKAWQEAENKMLKNRAEWPFGYHSSPDYFIISKDEYIQNAKDSAISTFALIKDGRWYERGKMGWWACVSNEKDESDWNKEFSQLLDEIPEDTLLSIYDCHI